MQAAPPPGGCHYQVEIVANGPAVQAYTAPGSQIARMQSLAVRGVVFIACQNALRSNGISTQALPGFVHTVPAGIAELVDRQEEGWAYVKP
nr:DsrE family protein [Neobittarella massiliensis]